MLEKKTENEGESGSARILTPEREQVELREFWLDGAIPAGHPVRAVWAFVEGLDLTDLYRGIGSVEGGLDDRRRTRGADRPLREAEEGEGGGAEGGRSLEAEEGPGPDGVGRVDQDGDDQDAGRGPGPQQGREAEGRDVEQDDRHEPDHQRERQGSGAPSPHRERDAGGAGSAATADCTAPAAGPDMKVVAVVERFPRKHRGGGRTRTRPFRQPRAPPVVRE